MQTSCKILLLAAIGILCGTEFVFCEETKELKTENRVSEYITRRPLPLLWAHGDYTKLKLIIRSNKKDYDPGEPVNIMFFMRNDSDQETRVQHSLGINSGYSFEKLFYSNKDEAPMLPVWRERAQRLKEREARGEYDRTLRNQETSGYHIRLQPGEERQLGEDQLNQYFDLSKPDTYELTCFLATACFGQYYESPLQSNTLTFRVLEKKASKSTEAINPPKGKEVFKQPKPPKSVFYVYEDDEPGEPWIWTKGGRSIAKPRTIIGISPAMYYLQKVKEQE